PRRPSPSVELLEVIGDELRQEPGVSLVDVLLVETPDGLLVPGRVIARRSCAPPRAMRRCTGRKRAHQDHRCHRPPHGPPLACPLSTHGTGQRACHGPGWWSAAGCVSDRSESGTERGATFAHRNGSSPSTLPGLASPAGERKDPSYPNPLPANARP